MQSPTASPATTSGTVETRLVRLDGAVFGYAARRIVHAPSLGLDRGICIGIFGPNGAGKTTLIRGLTGLLPPLEGSVEHRRGIGGRPIRFGYVPQYRGVDLLWPMTGFDVAALAVSSITRFGWLRRSIRRKILASMARLQVDTLAHRAFATLSGGQQQRLLLAGALAAEPDVLVLDEPTDGLDVRSRENLLSLLRELTKEGLATALISHDVEDLIAVCQRVAWLHPAQLPGSPSEVESISPADLADRVLHARRPA